MYGDSDSEIFRAYLEAAERGVGELRRRLTDRLRDPELLPEQQKRLVANLVQLDSEGASETTGAGGTTDPAWECVENKQRHVMLALDSCCREHSERHRRDLEAQAAVSAASGAATPAGSQFPASPSSKNLLLAAERDEDEVRVAFRIPPPPS